MTDARTADDTRPADTGGKPPRKAGSPRRRYIWLASLVALVVGAWSAYWAVARGMTEDLLHNAAAVARAEGREIACGGESLSGYPFQFELSCAPLRLADETGRSVTASGFRAVALAYNPRHVILEADSPLTLSGLAPAGLPSGNIVANWQLAQASARLGDGGLDRADLALTAPQLVLAEGTGDPAPLAIAAARRAGLHLRAAPDGSGDTDLAASASEIVIPAFATPLELSATARLAGGQALLGGGEADLAALLSRDGALQVTSLSVKGADFELAAQGSLSLDGKGRLQGELPLTVTGADRLPALLGPLFPQGSNASTALAGAILAFGRPGELDGRPAVTVPLAFRDGVARVGLIPIAPLTPLM